MIELESNDDATATQVIYSASSVAERRVGSFLVAEKIYSVCYRCWFTFLCSILKNACISFRFCDCVEQMTGKRPNLFWFLCWKYMAPAVMFVSFLFFKVTGSLYYAYVQYIVLYIKKFL
jgi:hypothetical protein